MVARNPIRGDTTQANRRFILSPRRCLLTVAASLAVAAASVAPAQNRSSLDSFGSGVQTTGFDASTDLVEPDSRFNFAFDVHTAGDDAFRTGSLVDSGGVLTANGLSDSLVTRSNGNGGSNAFVVDLSDFAGAGQFQWQAEVFAFDAGADLSALGDNGATVGGADQGFLQSPQITSEEDFGNLISFLGGSGEHVGSFSGVVDLNDGETTNLLIIIGLVPVDENGLGGNGGNGSVNGPAMVPTPAAVGPGLALLAGLLLKRRRQSPAPL
ncbi:MAG: hypothetical protein WD534_14390 [Phycisphaeraceae bacterium]